MLKVAFATDNRIDVNQHFGSTRGFAIYALDSDRSQLVGVSEFPEDAMDGNEDKLVARIDALAGCAAVYCLAAGASAVRQLLAHGVQPLRLDAHKAIETLLAELGRAVRDGSVPWIDKTLRRTTDSGRFDRMAEEGWQE